MYFVNSLRRMLFEKLFGVHVSDRTIKTKEENVTEHHI